MKLVEIWEISIFVVYLLLIYLPLKKIISGSYFGPWEEEEKVTFIGLITQVAIAALSAGLAKLLEILTIRYFFGA